MTKTAQNKQIVFFAESKKKTVKLKLFLEKAKNGHRGEFSDKGQLLMLI